MPANQPFCPINVFNATSLSLSLQVPFPVLQGEWVEFLGRADDAIIAISNYRLHIKFKDSIINVRAPTTQTKEFSSLNHSSISAAAPFIVVQLLKSLFCLQRGTSPLISVKEPFSGHWFDFSSLWPQSSGRSEERLSSCWHTGLIFSFFPPTTSLAFKQENCCCRRSSDLSEVEV